MAQWVKNLPPMQEPWRMGLIPGLGRSPGEGHGNPLQYSCLENSMDRRAWQATVHGVAKSWTQLKQLTMHACTGLWSKKSQGLIVIHSLFESSLINLYDTSVQFSRSVMSTLWPQKPQHTRLPCPSPTPRVHPNPCPLYQWCHPIISSSVIPFSSCPQSFPASGSFQMSELSPSGGQSIEVSASTSVPSMNTQD